MTEWPEDVSKDAIERACEAARMGVNTAVVLGNSSMREVVQENLMVMAADAVFDPRYGISTWVFDGGGELLLTANLNAARLAYHQRNRSSEILEVVYPKSGRL